MVVTSLNFCRLVDQLLSAARNLNDHTYESRGVESMDTIGLSTTIALPVQPANTALPAVSAPKQHLDSQRKRSEALPFGIVETVDEAQFERVADQWMSVQTFAWCLKFNCNMPGLPYEQALFLLDCYSDCYKNMDIEDESETTFLPEMCEIEGICICWEKDSVVWIPLGKSADKR